MEGRNRIAAKIIASCEIKQFQVCCPNFKFQFSEFWYYYYSFIIICCFLETFFFFASSLFYQLSKLDYDPDEGILIWAQPKRLENHYYTHFLSYFHLLLYQKVHIRLQVVHSHFPSFFWCTKLFCSGSLSVNYVRSYQIEAESYWAFSHRHQVWQKD